MAHRPGVSESRRFFIPLPRPLIVLGRTLAFLVQNAQVSHRTIVPRRRSLPIPLLKPLGNLVALRGHPRTECRGSSSPRGFREPPLSRTIPLPFGSPAVPPYPSHTDSRDYSFPRRLRRPPPFRTTASPFGSPASPLHRSRTARPYSSSPWHFRLLPPFHTTPSPVDSPASPPCRSNTDRQARSSPWRPRWPPPFHIAFSPADNPQPAHHHQALSSELLLCK